MDGCLKLINIKGDNNFMSEQEPATASGPSFQVRGQYVKDLSFENPNAPQSLLASSNRPQIDINVDLRAQKMQDNMFEVTLNLSARATADVSFLFLAELAYAGIFELNGIPEEAIENVLLVDCPFLLFPFARRVISDVTRDGGFPPLVLDPIDFHQLYLQNKAKPAA